MESLVPARRVCCRSRRPRLDRFQRSVACGTAMTKALWQSVLDAEVQRWSTMPLEELFARLRELDVCEIELQGKMHQVEVELLQDTGKHLQIMIAVDDGTLPRSLSPLTQIILRDPPTRAGNRLRAGETPGSVISGLVDAVSVHWRSQQLAHQRPERHPNRHAANKARDGDGDHRRKVERFVAADWGGQLSLLSGN